MFRFAFSLALLLAAGAPAAAQPVEVTQLAAPDAFSTPGRDTGLPRDLWRGASIEAARTVLPLLTNPLSPASAALARRVLATGAPGPQGASGDEALAGARSAALIALGDVTAATRILDRQPGLDRNPTLARAAAETALLGGDTARACAIGEGLATGRDDVYWLRLRAYCQAEGGQQAQAQLTFDLAQTQGRDAVYGRLMSARLLGTPPGAASARNGLDLALSKSLGLDVAGAKPGPAVVAAMSGAAPELPSFDVSAIDAATGGLAEALKGGLPPPQAVSALIAAAADADGKTRGRVQSAALLIAALVPELSGADRARLAGFATPEGKGSAGRSLALADAAERKAMGETALFALWTAADAGAGGPALGDRVRIVRALAHVGLTDEARLMALEGLAGLK